MGIYFVTVICLVTLIFSVFYWIGVFSSEIAGYPCQTIKKYLGEENFITRRKKRQRLMGDVFDKLKIDVPKKKKNRSLIGSVQRRMSSAVHGLGVAVLAGEKKVMSAVSRKSKRKTKSKKSKMAKGKKKGKKVAQVDSPILPGALGVPLETFDEEGAEDSVTPLPMRQLPEELAGRVAAPNDESAKTDATAWGEPTSDFKPKPKRKKSVFEKGIDALVAVGRPKRGRSTKKGKKKRRKNLSNPTDSKEPSSEDAGPAEENKEASSGEEATTDDQGPVHALLVKNGLEAHWPTLKENGAGSDVAWVAANITDEDLKEMGISAVFVRKRLMTAFREASS